MNENDIYELKLIVSQENKLKQIKKKQNQKDRKKEEEERISMN